MKQLLRPPVTGTVCGLLFWSATLLVRVLLLVCGSVGCGCRGVEFEVRTVCGPLCFVLQALWTICMGNTSSSCVPLVSYTEGMEITQDPPVFRANLTRTPFSEVWFYKNVFLTLGLWYSGKARGNVACSTSGAPMHDGPDAGPASLHVALQHLLLGMLLQAVCSYAPPARIACGHFPSLFIRHHIIRAVLLPSCPIFS